MSTSTKRARRGDNISPVAVRAVTITGWVWLALCLIGAIVFQVLTARLPASTWFLLVGGRSSASRLLPFVTGHLALVAWIAVLLAAGAVVLQSRVARPTRAWPMLVAILVVFAAVLFLSSLVVGGVPQAANGHRLTESAARAMFGGAAEAASFIGGALVLITMVGVPGVLARRGGVASGS